MQEALRRCRSDLRLGGDHLLPLVHTFSEEQELSPSSLFVSASQWIHPKALFLFLFFSLQLLSFITGLLVLSFLTLDYITDKSLSPFGHFQKLMNNVTFWEQNIPVRVTSSLYFMSTPLRSAQITLSLETCDLKDNTIYSPDSFPVV